MGWFTGNSNTNGRHLSLNNGGRTIGVPGNVNVRRECGSGHPGKCGRQNACPNGVVKVAGMVGNVTGKGPRVNARGTVVTAHNRPGQRSITTMGQWHRQSGNGAPPGSVAGSSAIGGVRCHQSVVGTGQQWA